MSKKTKHREAMATIFESSLLEYFAQFGPKRSDQLEDDFFGEFEIIASPFEIIASPPRRWRASPFYLALGRLVDQGVVHSWMAEDGEFWYKLSSAPRIEIPKVTVETAEKRQDNFKEELNQLLNKHNASLVGGAVIVTMQSEKIGSLIKEYTCFQL